MNLRIKHKCMPFPEGEVIPLAAWPGDPTRHIELGALEPTDAAATISLDDVPRYDVAELTDDVLAAENAKLKEKLGKLPLDNVRLQKQVESLTAERDKLRKKLDDVTAERDKLAEAVKAKVEAAQRNDLLNDKKPTPADGK